MTKSSFRLTLFFLVCFSIPLTVTAQTVDIPDPNLRAAIATQLGKPSGATITTADIANLTELTARNASIRDLTGLEAATNLTVLHLGAVLAAIGFINSNSVSDLSPLAGLNKLEELYLERNLISDISPLAALNNLTDLWLWGNSISDISPVAGLNQLTWLQLGNNNISDISPLVANTGLGNGDRIYLQGNPLSHLSIHTHIPALQSRGVTVRFDDIVARPADVNGDGN